MKLQSAETHDVADCAIQRQNASGQLSLIFAAVLLYPHLETAQLVHSVRHAGSADRVGNKDCPVWTFSAKKQLNDRWMNVNSIRDDVRSQLIAFQHSAQNARIAMIQ